MSVLEFEERFEQSWEEVRGRRIEDFANYV